MIAFLNLDQQLSNEAELSSNAMLVGHPQPSDNEILSRMANDEVEAYELLFYRFYTPLCQFVLKYTGNEVLSEEIVQETFINFWEKRNGLIIHTSLKSYLYTSVKNSALNYLKSQYARQNFNRDFFDQEEISINTTQETILFDELQILVQKAIDKLPEKCRIIYLLNRNSGLSYQEIADELGISVKTVEAQMGIALKKLRTYLNFHWDILLIVFLLNLSA